MSAPTREPEAIATLRDVITNTDPYHAQFTPLLEYLDAIVAERDAAVRELDVERQRLAACGVAALGYFDGCADEYRSASLDDVLRLRARLAACEKIVEAAKEMLKFGQHDGPCTNRWDREDHCEHHVAASKRRTDALRAAVAAETQGEKDDAL